MQADGRVRALRDVNTDETTLYSGTCRRRFLLHARGAPSPGRIGTRRAFWPLVLGLMMTQLGVPACAQTQRRDAPDPTHHTPGPVFSAHEILDAKLLRGRNYTIQERVPVYDDRYLFTLETDDGIVTAHGMPMLQVRLDEMESLRQARKLDEEPQEMEGIKESFKQTGRGLEALLKDPGEALGNIPRGIGRKIKSIGDKGGGSTRRQFAAAVGADPETDNPPLKKILDKLALRRGIGKGAVTVGGFLITAGAANLAMVVRGASALRTTADMNEAVRTTPLYKINEKISAELAAMGVGPELREQFIKHEAITTVQRLLFLEQFKRLHRVTGSQLLVRRAVVRRARADVVALIHVMELLARIHEQKPLREFIDSRYLLVRLRDGSLLCIHPADYLTDAPILGRELAAVRAAHPDTGLTLLITGRADPAAHETLAAHRVRLIENGDISGL